MNVWIESIGFLITGVALLLSGMGLWFTVIIPGIDRWSKRFFISYFLVFMLCCFSGITEKIFQYYLVDGALFYVLLLLETLLLSLPMPMLTIYLLHCCKENIRPGKLLHIVLVLFAILFLVLVSALFIDGFCYVSPNNRYHRGPLYPLFLAPILAIQLLNLVGTIRRRKQLSRKTFLGLLIAILPITITVLVQMFIDIYPIIDICTILSALVMYSFILSDQIEQDRRHKQEIIRQQQEIARERSSVMVLQMRPHFIYNTLMSIYCLCRSDPQKARQTTMDFANYLRNNFNAVASNSTIPFSKELEHTLAYLSVEQTQFDDMLVVDYDTPFTQFRLPPLTLQPIVENAVKHGMDLDSEPLHIIIRTRHTDSGGSGSSAAEIIVEDTGNGFDSSDESKSHTTLTNIRQRLEMMCGGHMDITPREGGGTVVTVTIPDSATQ